MKLRYILFFGILFTPIVEGIAVPPGYLTCTIYSCKPGYYLNGAVCTMCPNFSDRATSADKNDTGITACYFPVGEQLGDETGVYTFTNDCYYTL